jgi:chitinase
MLVSMRTLAAAPAFAAAPAWHADVFYAAGTVVAFNGGDYSALVNQTAYGATGWNPTTASLWQFIGPDSSSGSGSASPTCNSYGQAGRLGFTTQFLSNPGL